MTNTDFLVRHRGHQHLYRHRSEGQASSISALTASRFTLPASSLPCASAGSRHVWGEGKKQPCYWLSVGGRETHTDGGTARAMTLWQHFPGKCSPERGQGWAGSAAPGQEGNASPARKHLPRGASASGTSSSSAGN